MRRTRLGGTDRSGWPASAAASANVGVRKRSSRMRARSTSATSNCGCVAEAFGLGQQGAEFVHRALPVPRKVGAALAGAGRGVNIGGHRPYRVRRRQRCTVGRLADGDVGRGQIGQHCRTGKRRVRRRRDGRPVVLANLHTDREVGEVGGGKDEVRAERHGGSGDGDLQSGRPGARGEPALLVVLPIVGQERLRHDAQDLAATDHHSGVVQPPVASQRCADEQDGRKLPAGVADSCNGPFGSVEQGILHQQVVDGVRRHPEFGEHDEVDSVGICLPGEVNGGLCIACGICR